MTEMTKKILVNGIEVIVKKEDFGDLVGKFKDGVQVEDLEDLQSTVIHEPYDFNELIEKAKEYSDNNPPDFEKFSEKAWEATSICVKVFFLKHLAILVRSPSARSDLLRAIYAGLNGRQTVEVVDVWTEVERWHTDLYDMMFMRKGVREALLKSIKEMAATIEKADVYAVRTELQNITSVNIATVEEAAYKIGNSATYNYDHVAY